MLLALGPSAIVKVLAKWLVCFLFFATNGFRLPQGSLVFIRFKVSHGFWGKRQLLQKRFCGAFPQQFFTFVSQMVVASEKFFGGFRQLHFTALYMYLPVSMLGSMLSGLWHVSTIQINPQKRTHHVVAVGVFFGFIFSQNNQWRIARNPSCVKQTLQKTIKSKSREKVLHIAFPFPYKMHRDTKYHMFPLQKFRSIVGWCFLCLM